MTPETFATLDKLHKAWVDSARELGRIQVRAAERLFEQQLAATEDWLATGSRQLQALAASTDLHKAMVEQARLGSELSERMAGRAKATGEVLVDTRSELAQWTSRALEATAPAEGPARAAA